VEDDEERDTWPPDIIAFNCYGEGDRWKFVLNCGNVERSWNSEGLDRLRLVNNAISKKLSRPHPSLRSARLAMRYPVCFFGDSDSPFREQEFVHMDAQTSRQGGAG
jgi:hypothetical protein